MVGKNIDVFVLIHEGGFNGVKPETWMTAYPGPFISRELVLIED